MTNPGLKYLPNLHVHITPLCPGSAFLQYQGMYWLRPLKIISEGFDTEPSKLLSTSLLDVGNGRDDRALKISNSVVPCSCWEKDISLFGDDSSVLTNFC